jgi:hypothetical protein
LRVVFRFSFRYHQNTARSLQTVAFAEI